MHDKVKKVNEDNNQEDGAQVVNIVQLNHVNTKEKKEAKKAIHKAKIKFKDTVGVVKDDNTEKDTEEVVKDDNMEADNIICLHHIAIMTPHQVKSIVWYPRIKRFTQKSSANHTSLQIGGEDPPWHGHGHQW